MSDLNRQLASFLRRWVKHTKYIHDMDCDCRAFEMQAAIFVKKLTAPRRKKYLGVDDGKPRRNTDYGSVS